MDKLELARILAVFMHQFCDVPDVLNVSLADRFGEQVVSVTIPTIDEHDTVSSMITDEYPTVRVHISPLFGIGSFTGESEETKKVMSLIYVSPYNVHGTPENRELEKLMDGVMAREREAWTSMDVETRRKEIEKEVEKRRASGWPDFGNCISK